MKIHYCSLIPKPAIDIYFKKNIFKPCWILETIYSREFGHSICINFCPWCGEKLDK